MQVDLGLRLPHILYKTRNVKKKKKKKKKKKRKRSAGASAVWSESPLSTWRTFAFLVIQNVPSDYSDQTLRVF